MGKIPQNIIDQLLDSLDIVEVVGESVSLKRSGRNFKACCPFHNEKSPSFVVSPDKQIYHCFGCSAGGNVIGFVMQQESVDFREAVSILAERTGIVIPEMDGPGGEEESLSSKLYRVNGLASIFYQNTLREPVGKKALEYLLARGFTMDTLSEFRIGYAPDGWEYLSKYCRAKGVPRELLRKSGLSLVSDKGHDDYDRFRNRIIFPIFNERGAILGFGARVLDNSLPKYINSPETPIYSKSNVLYGLNFAKQSIREKGFVLIVEGYMDVIVPFQDGVKNLVAASGTALTQRQVSLLKKYTDTAVMIFDSDQAGENASLRGLDILMANDMHVKIVTLPPGEDPDSYIKKNGKEAFEAMLKTAKDLFDYKLLVMERRHGAEDIRGKSLIAGEMLATIAKIGNAVVKEAYLTRLATRLNITVDALRLELGKVKPEYQPGTPVEVASVKVRKDFINSEIHLLGLAIEDKGAYLKIREELGVDILRDESVINIFTLLDTLYDESDDIIPAKLLSHLEQDINLKTAVLKAMEKIDVPGDRERMVEDCICCVKKENAGEDLEKLKGQLRIAQSENNPEKMSKLVEKINDLHRKAVS
jgi:DNA primase